MASVRPKYVIALLAVLGIVVAIRLMNPNKRFSTDEFWESATLESVFEVPETTLAPGNPNGGVLMWAAMGTSNPEIIKALVERGADVNESDLFMGTPLSGAAGHGKDPAIISELVRLGADVNHRVGGGNTVLMIAAMYNHQPGIIEELIAQEVDVNAQNNKGETALDLAKAHKNSTAEQALTALTGR